ncbi:tetratricopeptide repeat protein [Streptomyces pinistramenti]|uniref:tetratricopeptide repeat protein n=1 Tax=Streptomyces pinistramenti TaxID=2884812 RepID=UPI001D0902AE|nr:tetratricopeptide repeat protein [Streptomyces pinistramenti]MCB5910042.1 tetratricopeptide repeat protein [Streptomyces pinistramenti]
MPLFGRGREVDAAPASRVEASRGANAAGRDLINSVAQHIEHGVVLPPEAYGPLADVAAPARLSNVPRTQGFVGRTEQLDHLDAAFTAPGEVVVQAVHGLGGIGKSSLAAHWATHRFTGNPCWWITADSRPSVEADLAELARALQPALIGLPEEALVERALQWLAAHEDWLIILDNVDRPDDIRPLIDRVPSGRFLITTRRATGWHHTATALRLDVLDRPEAVDLFTGIHPHPADRDGVAELCAELGHLPLAVEQAAAYCAETHLTPRAYLDLFTASPAHMFAEAAEGTDAARTIARVWRLTLDRLADTPLAGDILRLIAWYAPTGIPRSLLDDCAPAPAVHKAIGRLTAYSMITTADDGTLGIHRLVQTLARTPDPDDPHRQTTDIDHAHDQATLRLEGAFPHAQRTPEVWPRCRELLPHANALTGHTPTRHDVEATARLLLKAGAFLQEQGMNNHAAQHLHRAVDDRQRLLGDDHPDTLTARSNLAGAYQSAGDLQQAVPLLQRTLTDIVRVLGNDHPHTLITRNNLAHAYQSAGHPQQAIPLLQRTLTDIVRVLGNDHPHTLITRNNLAHAYQSTGHPQQAIPLLQHTLTDHERILGNDHPDTLTTRNNLAGAYQTAGHPQRAIPLSERTLTDSLRVLGGDHPDTLTARSNLASAYQSAGDPEQAIPLLQQTLTDRARILGNDHPHTLTTRNNLAHAYQSTGHPQQAIPLLQRTLTDRARILGNDHPDTLASRNNLAGAYQAAGDPERAIPLFERTLTDSERILGNGHPHTLITRNNLASTYQSAGDPEQAIPLFEHTLTDSLRVLGEDHPVTRAARTNLEHARSR